MALQRPFPAAMAAVLALAATGGVTPSRAHAPSQASAQNSNQVPGKPQFVQQAAASNQFEIQASRLALERSQNPGVRAFAQQMVADHGKAAGDMQAVLSRDPSVPVPPAALDTQGQARLTQLQGTPAGDFDRTYVQLEDAAHRQALALFTAYARNGAPGPIHDFATATLPVLQMHLDRVQALKSTVR